MLTVNHGVRRAQSTDKRKERPEPNPQQGQHWEGGSPLGSELLGPSLQRAGGLNSQALFLRGQQHHVPQTLALMWLPPRMAERPLCING